MKHALLELGPAQIVLVSGPYQPSGKNEIVLETQGDKSEVKYHIYSAKKEVPPKHGVAKAGSEIETGWM